MLDSPKQLCGVLSDCLHVGEDGEGGARVGVGGVLVGFGTLARIDAVLCGYEVFERG